MAIRKQAELGRDSNVHPHGRTGLLRFDQVKNDFFSAQLNMLSEHVRSDYGHEYFIAFWNTIAKFFEKHANPYPEQVCLVWTIFAATNAKFSIQISYHHKISCIINVLVIRRLNLVSNGKCTQINE